MFPWLRHYFAGEDGETAVLNHGLSLAMEWGENWLKPIQPRLAIQFPQLKTEELDEVNTICQKAMRFGWEMVQQMAETSGENVDKGEWATAVHIQYPWINEENLGRLFSQGMYYAWKDGLVG